LNALVELARVGVCKPPSPPCGIGDFSPQFPVTEVISVIFVMCSLTLSFLEYSLQPERSLSCMELAEASPVASPLDEPLIQGQASRRRTTETSHPLHEETTSKIRRVFNFLLERTERTNTDQFGRRLPGRRLMLSLGLFLNLWVLSAFYTDNNGFRSGFVLQTVRKSLETLDSGNLVWPANGTKFDDTFAVYGRFLQIEFCMMAITAATLLCAVWCDFTCRSCNGLVASRIYGYIALALMFLASLVPALPNYINISHLGTVCPYCTPKFNFAVQSALQDMVGIGCAAVFATKLLPVLLIVMPSLVRACSLVLLAEASVNKEYTSTMGNVQNTLAITTIMTPLVTAIPTIVAFQILRRFGQQTFMAWMLAIFYAIPTLCGFMRPTRLFSIELRLLVYSFFYFVPLLIIGVYEAHRFDFMRDIYAQLKNPMTYAEFACEVFLANVILSDMILSSVYVYEAGQGHQRQDRRQYLRRVLVLPACFLATITCIVVAVWWPANSSKL
jgi:hypothetical protein